MANVGPSLRAVVYDDWTYLTLDNGPSDNTNIAFDFGDGGEVITLPTTAVGRAPTAYGPYTASATYTRADGFHRVTTQYTVAPAFKVEIRHLRGGTLLSTDAVTRPLHQGDAAVTLSFPVLSGDVVEYQLLEPGSGPDVYVPSSGHSTEQAVASQVTADFYVPVINL